MNTFDLQIQSIASDGAHTPSEIIAMARGAGVVTIALTDHDTVLGVAEALEAGRAAGVRVIPGIEMSVEEHDIHVLGLGIDPTNAPLLRALEEFRADRVEGAKKIVENLKTNEGFAIEWEDVLREAMNSSTIARPHIVSAVMKRPENAEKLAHDSVKEKADFFNRYLSNESRNFVKRAHVSAKDGIGLIHAAGGVAVWSHPVIPDFKSGEYDELEKFLQELILWEIDGLEVWSASHREDDVEFLWGMSEKYGLLKTGGSDFHDRGAHPRAETGLHSADTIGDFETYGFPTENVLSRLLEAIEKHRQ